jgi:hypothetical protein
MLNHLLVRIAGFEVGIGSAHRVISASRLDSAAGISCRDESGEDGARGAKSIRKGTRPESTADAKAEVEGGSPFMVRVACCVLSQLPSRSPFTELIDVLPCDRGSLFH